MRHSIFLAASALLVCAASTFAQQPGALAPIEDAGSTIVADGHLRFDDAMGTFARTLSGSVGYTVAIETRWETEQGGQTTSGQTSARLIVQNPDRLRLDIAAGGNADARYTVVSDGQRILRELAGRKAYSLDPIAGSPRAAIEADGITLASTRSAGVDFLLREDVRGAIAAQTLRALEGAVVERGGKRLQTWLLARADGSQVELLVDEGPGQIPIEWRSVTTVPLAGGSSFTLKMTTALTWQFGVVDDPNVFATAPTAGFERVFDLTGRVEQVAQQVAGNPAPRAAWLTLDGAPVSLAALQGQTPVVLLFWATWAAPSAEAMPDLRNYAEEFSKKGVRIVALNVGETKDQVETFAKGIGYDGELGLDPRAEAMAAFALETTPSVVLIDRQGNVRGVWQGLEGDAKKRIYEATVTMLQEEAAATGR